MHSARLDFLATKHAVPRAVTARDVRDYGTRVTFECGHGATIAPHFDARHMTHGRCFQCGKAYVKSSPKYAAEFAPAQIAVSTSTK